MSVTRWEHTRGLSDVLRSIWDTKRDGVATWEQSFNRAKADLVAKLHRDADTVTSMTWDEFKRLQGFGEAKEGGK